MRLYFFRQIKVLKKHYKHLVLNILCVAQFVRFAIRANRDAATQVIKC